MKRTYITSLVLFFLINSFGQSIKQIVSHPDGEGKLVVFILSKAGTVQYKMQESISGVWGDWRDFGGSQLLQINAGSNADKRIELFALGGDHSLWHKYQTSVNGEWSEWGSLGGTNLQQIVSDNNADGRLEAFALGGDHALWHKYQNTPNGGWSEWAYMGGTNLQQLVTGKNADGRLEVFAIGGDHALWHKYQTAPNGGWSEWAYLGGTDLQQIVTGNNADGRLEVFALGGDHAVWHKYQTAPNGGWSEWAYLGGTNLQQIVSNTNADGRLEIFALGGDGALWHKYQTSPNGGWSEWAYLGGTELQQIFADRNADGRIEVFAAGGDNSVWHKFQTAPNGGWGEWGYRGQPVSILGIEIVQAIQEIHNFVPLIAGKTTWVRVYIKSGTNDKYTINGRLLVRNLSDGNSVTINSNTNSILDPANDNNLEQKRNSLSESLNFIIPANFNTEGNCIVQVDGIIDAVTGKTLSCSDCGTNSRSVFFIKSPQMRLRIVGLQYTVNNPPPTQTFAPTARDFNLSPSWLNRAYPVAQLNSSQITVTSSDDWPFDCNDANSQLSSLRAADIDNNISTGRTHYLSLVSDGAGFMRGCADLPGYVASGPTGPTWTNDLDGSYGDWYGGHELGHNYDRRHPGFCPGNSKDDDAFPYPNGQITNATYNFIGLDVGDAANMIPARIIPGTSFDIMTYCSQPQWLSSYTYVNILHRLQDETAAASKGGSGDGQTIGGIQQATSGYISITGIINLSLQTGKMKYIQRVHKAFINNTDDSLHAFIVLTDGTGQARRIRIGLRRLSDQDTAAEKKVLLDAIVPYNTDIRTVELEYNDKVVDKIVVSKHIPVVTDLNISASAGRGEKNIAARWIGSDDDNDALTYMVQLQNREGLWETIALAIRKPEITITAQQLKEGPWQAIRIVANDGFNSSKAVEMRL